MIPFDLEEQFQKYTVQVGLRREGQPELNKDVETQLRIAFIAGIQALMNFQSIHVQHYTLDDRVVFFKKLIADIQDIWDQETFLFNLKKQLEP